jgi:nucleoside triphosphate pyrophosphatase
MGFIYHPDYMHLLLASASPRRAELLTSAGFDFEIAPSDVDETVRDGESPAEYALRVARDKAMVAGAACRKSGTVVLAADTVVVAGQSILGKPANRADAETMLKTLSGAVHDVLTAVVLRQDDREVSEVVRTRVRLLPLSQAEIDWYIDSGEPEGKAGAYAIQGRAARFIDWIDGSWSNVVGLPVATVYGLLKRLEGTIS